MFFIKAIFFSSIFLSNLVFSMDNTVQKPVVEALDFFYVWRNTVSQIEAGEENIFAQALEGNLFQFSDLDENKLKESLKKRISILELSLLSLAASSEEQCFISFFNEYKKYDLLESDDLNKALLVAAYFNKQAIMDFLLKGGATLHSKVTVYLVSPIHIAASSPNGEGLDFLLKKYQIDNLIDFKDKNNNTPMHYAAFNNSSISIELLNNANKLLLEQRNNDEQTPLLLAAFNQHKNAIDKLLELNADPQAIEKSTDTIITTALEAVTSNDEFVILDIYKLIKERLSHRIGDWNDLIRKPCEHDKWTALHLAARNNMPHLLQWLLAEGLSLSALNETDSTALHIAADNGSLEALKFMSKWILEHGEINIELRNLLSTVNSNNDTLLHCAIDSGSLETVVYIYGLKHDLIDIRNDDDLTPLFKAIDSENPLIIAFILNKLPTLDYFNICGESPLSALLKGEYDLGDLKGLIKQMFAKGLTIVNQKNIKNGDSPLHTAVEHFVDVDIIKYLIEIGACANAKNNKNISVFDVACNSNNIEAVKFLVKRGAWVGDLKKGPLKEVSKLQSEDEDFRELKEFLLFIYKTRKSQSVKRDNAVIVTNKFSNDEIEKFISSEFSKPNRNKRSAKKKPAKPKASKTSTALKKNLENKSPNNKEIIIANQPISTKPIERKIKTNIESISDPVGEGKFRKIAVKKRISSTFSVLKRVRNLSTENVHINRKMKLIEVIDRSEIISKDDDNYSKFTIHSPKESNHCDVKEKFASYKKIFSYGYDKTNLIDDYLHSFPSNIDELIVNYGKMGEGKFYECEEYQHRMAKNNICSRADKFYKFYLRASLDEIHPIHKEAAHESGNLGQQSGEGCLELFFFINEKASTIIIVHRFFRPDNNAN